MRTLHDCIVPPEMQLNRVLNKALALYDYTTTLHQEITTLWKRRKSLAAIVILVNRYALVAYALVSIIMLLPFPVGGNPITDQVRRSHHTSFGNNTDACQRCFILTQTFKNAAKMKGGHQVCCHLESRKCCICHHIFYCRCVTPC